MRLAAEMACAAALELTESRGAHFREDHPSEDNRNWLKNIVIRKSGDHMAMETAPTGPGPVETKS